MFDPSPVLVVASSVYIFEGVGGLKLMIGRFADFYKNKTVRCKQRRRFRYCLCFFIDVVLTMVKAYVNISQSSRETLFLPTSTTVPCFHDDLLYSHCLRTFNYFGDYSNKKTDLMTLIHVCCYMARWASWKTFL